MERMYYIGLDVHKRKISYCVKEAAAGFTPPAGLNKLSRSTAPLLPRPTTFAELQ